MIGPTQFDKNGDITGPFRLWRIQNGEVTTVGQMSMEEVAVEGEVGADTLAARTDRAGRNPALERHSAFRIPEPR